MYEKTTKIVNKTGLHARPASIFVQAAKGYQAKITLTNLEKEKSADAKSMIKVLTLALVKGTPIKIEADGEDEKEAVDALITLIDSGFDDL